MKRPSPSNPFAERLSSALATSWRTATKHLHSALTTLHAASQLTQQSAIYTTRITLLIWPKFVLRRYESLIDQAFTAGFTTGTLSTSLVPQSADRDAFSWLKSQPNGFIPSLHKLADDMVRTIEQQIRLHYQTVDQLSSQQLDISVLTGMIDKATNVGVTRARLIARSETTRAEALGRILSWGADPKRDWYTYEWQVVHDSATKDISLKFEREGPYTYLQMKYLWEVLHNTPQLVRNRHTGKMEYQTSVYACRCSTSRTPKSLQQLRQEGLISRNQRGAAA